MVNKKRGFTLIELLVVIAIIGILASVVLASLSTARNKGNDAKVQGQMTSMRSAAEIFYSTNNGYGTTANCATGAGSMGVDTASGFANLVTAANYPGGVAPGCTTDSASGSNATKWSATHALSSDATKSYCVDSTGQSKTILTSAIPTAGAACP